MKPQWLWLHQSHLCSDSMGLEWRFLTPKFPGIFFFFLNHRKVGGGWNEKVQCWSTKSHQQQPSTSRGLNHLFLFIIVFQKHTCKGIQLECGLLSVLEMGAWVRWNQAYRDQEREVNLEGGRSGIFPCPNPTVWGLPSFKCGLKAKTKAMWEEGGCMVLVQWLKVSDFKWSVHPSWWTVERSSLITVKEIQYFIMAPAQVQLTLSQRWVRLKLTLISSVGNFKVQ